MIFGIPGSGKTTLSNKLSTKLDLPLVHVDQLYFLDNWIPRNRRKFLILLKDAIEGDRWIIDGNSISTLEERYKKADIAVYACLPRVQCLYRIFRRLFGHSTNSSSYNHLTLQPKVSYNLIKYLWNYNERIQGQLNYLNNKYTDVIFLKVHNNREMEYLYNILTTKKG